MRIDTSMAMMSYDNAKLKNQSQAVQNQDDAKLKEQTDHFEALLLKTMLQDAIKNEDTLYPKQPGSDIYHSMYIDQLSEELSGSFGYSQLLYQYLQDQQNQNAKRK